MSGTYRNSFDDTNNAQETELLGGTDQTRIGNSGDKLKVDGSGVTQPISAASLPLPTGASTSALQTTGNSSLSSIDSKTPALGQTTMSASQPVVIASNQTSIPISAASLPLPTGAATETTLSALNAKVPANLTVTSTRLLVDGSGVTQPVSGTITVVPADGTKASYSASISAFATAASATDVFTITGSASKVIRITRIEISCSTTSGTGIAANISAIIRSAANTAGTSVTLTDVTHDTTSAAGTAVVRYYTANPSSLGATVGTIRAVKYNALNTSVDRTSVIWDFGTRPTQAIVLRGTSQLLAINFGAVTVTGSSCSISIEWSEE